jgi:hypothetical protein
VTAEPDSLDRDILLDLLDPGAVGSGSGPGRSKESNADPGVERLGGGGHCEPNLDGPGRP